MKVHHVSHGRVTPLNWSQQRMIDHIADQLLKHGKTVSPAEAAAALGWPAYKAQKIMAELEELGLVQYHTASAPN